MVRKDAKFEIHDTGYIAIHGHELRRVSAWRKAYLKYAKPWSEKGSEALKCGIICRCLLYTSPSPRDRTRSRMPSSA